MGARKKHILIFIDWFEPGYKAGGPIRSVSNLIDALHEEYDFSIVTTDRDLGDAEPYPGIETIEWIQRERYRIWYASPEHRSYRHMRNRIFQTEYDILYVQSMFSLRFSFFPLFTSRALTPDAKMILAPRGMLHAGAMAFKTRKKRLFLRFFKLLQLHKAITFQATDAQEIEDIRKAFGDVDIHLAPNLPRAVLPPAAEITKQSGQLRLVYFSRISEKKGLHLLLQILKKQKGEIALELFGVQDEPEYWARCEALIAELPDNVAVQYKGTVPPAESVGVLQSAHAFVMPTQGENFGHAIFEALAAGRPVLISDQTPWRDLEARKAGWDIPLESPEGYGRALETLLDMDQETWGAWAVGAQEMAGSYVKNLDLEAVRALFRHEAPPSEA